MTETPLVSVIIPAYYSSGVIEGCLLSITAQSYVHYEVIIVNSSPETDTEKTVHETLPEALFIQHHDRLLPQDAKGVGITHAKGELLAFIDPDCRAYQDWLEVLVRECLSGKEFVGGSMKNHRDSWLESGIHICKFHETLGGSASGPIWIIPFSNACLKASTWKTIGPFKPDLFCSDSLISFKARKIGLKPWFEPKAIVAHIHGLILSDLIKQRFFRGFEFIQERIRFEKWSRLRMLAIALSAPLLTLFVLYRSAGNAIAGGMGRSFFTTLPVQILGQCSWIMGESLGCLRLLIHKDDVLK